MNADKTPRCLFITPNINISLLEPSRFLVKTAFKVANFTLMRSNKWTFLKAFFSHNPNYLETFKVMHGIAKNFSI